jgi:hypothetical protein
VKTLRFAAGLGILHRPYSGQQAVESGKSLVGVPWWGGGQPPCRSHGVPVARSPLLRSQDGLDDSTRALLAFRCSAVEPAPLVRC